MHESRCGLVRKDTVVTEADLLMVLIVKLKAVETDVVGVPPGC